MVYQVEGGLTRELNLILAKDRSITQAAQALVEHVRVSVAQRMRQAAIAAQPARAAADSGLRSSNLVASPESGRGLPRLWTRKTA